jgi:glutaconate CoA-transferase, subunit A
VPAEVVDVRTAVSRWVRPGAALAVGGMHMTSAPMALVREIVRQRVAVGRLVTSPSSSIQTDLLVGAGLVEELMSPYVGFEHLGLAPRFRAAVQEGRQRIIECDEGSLTHALYAGAGGLPFIPCPPGIERTDLVRVSPDLYRQVSDPFSGQTRWCVPALRPDVALLHCSEADEAGNVWFGGFPFTDRLMALAARTVVVQVERVVSAEVMAVRPPGTTLPAFLVSAVVVVPGGCHPTAAPGFYEADEEALGAYLAAARSPQGFDEYVRATVGADEQTYLDRASLPAPAGALP